MGNSTPVEKLVASLFSIIWHISGRSREFSPRKENMCRRNSFTTILNLCIEELIIVCCTFISIIFKLDSDV